MSDIFVEPKKNSSEIATLEKACIQDIQKVSGSNLYTGIYNEQMVVISFITHDKIIEKVDMRHNTIQSLDKAERFVRRITSGTSGIFGSEVIIPKVLEIKNVIDENGVERRIVISDTVEGMTLFQKLISNNITDDEIRLLARFTHSVESNFITNLITPIQTFERSRNRNIWHAFVENAEKWKTQLKERISDYSNLTELGFMVERLFKLSQMFNLQKVGRGGLHGRTMLGNVVVNEDRLVQYNNEALTGGYINYYSTASVIGMLLVWNHAVSQGFKAENLESNLDKNLSSGFEQKPKTTSKTLQLSKVFIDERLKMLNPIARMHFIEHFPYVLGQRLLGDLTDIINISESKEIRGIKKAILERNPNGVKVDEETLVENIHRFLIHLLDLSKQDHEN